MKHADASLLFKMLLRGLLNEKLDCSEQLSDDNAELKATEVDQIDDARTDEVVLLDKLEPPAGVAW